MYNRIRVSGVAVSAALLLATCLPQLRADSIDRKTVVTFGESVQIPGAVLEPGTYVLELADSPDRNIVQVFDKDQTHLVTRFLAIPDHRLEPPNRAVIQLEEREPNAPQAIHSWFYPGDSDGLEFVYPK
jgi:hypothetical protein